MYLDLKKIFKVLFFVFVGIIIGVVSDKIVTRLQAPKQTVTVTGYGEVEATTDQANITVQIKTVASTYEVAKSENKADVEVMKKQLLTLGIPESRITINSYSQPMVEIVRPETVDYIGRRPQETVPTVTTDLNITIDPIKNIDKLFDLVAKNPKVQVTNTYYSLKDRKTWESKAKEEALKDIRTQIESVAKINHLRVGKLRTLIDSENPRPYPMAIKAMSNDQAELTAQQDKSLDNRGPFYSEQTVKITSSYTATYELY